jgi:methionyl-tRNA formyltransferase
MFTMPSCVLLGTPEFAIPTAEVLKGISNCDFLGIITKPDEPVGRTQALTPPPLATWASEHSVRCWQPNTKAELTELLREIKPDVAVVVAYGKIIPPDALVIPQFGFVNIHPSLLPRWRGPSPVAAAIAAGDTETGVSLMLLDADIDHGPILAQESVPLAPTATRTTLERELAQRGATLLARTLPGYFAGQVALKPQDHAQATFSEMLTRDHGRLDWQEPAATLERKIRAYEGWPGNWFTLPNGKRLKVLQAANGATTDAPAGAITANDTFQVACGDHLALTLTRVQPDGGPPMDGTAFARGYRA